MYMHQDIPYSRRLCFSQAADANRFFYLSGGGASDGIPVSEPRPQPVESSVAVEVGGILGKHGLNEHIERVGRGPRGGNSIFLAQQLVNCSGSLRFFP
jgi:hypothetical protein